MCILEEEFFDCVEEIVEEYFDALEQFGKILNKHNYDSNKSIKTVCGSDQNHIQSKLSHATHLNLTYIADI